MDDEQEQELVKRIYESVESLNKLTHLAHTQNISIEFENKRVYNHDSKSEYLSVRVYKNL